MIPSLLALLQAAVDAARAPTFAELLSGAAVAVLLAFLGWVARIVTGLSRRFDRFEDTLFGPRGDTGLYGDVRAVNEWMRDIGPRLITLLERIADRIAPAPPPTAHDPYDRRERRASEDYR